MARHLRIVGNVVLYGILLGFLVDATLRDRATWLVLLLGAALVAALVLTAFPDRWARWRDARRTPRR
jgi:uncharacterized membrane protein YecN with MAPEG domain